MLSDAAADADEQRLLFYWAEDSESLSRQCLGHNRPFAMGAFVRAAGERESDSDLSDVAEVLRATKSAACPLTCCCLCTCGALPVRLSSFPYRPPRRPRLLFPAPHSHFARALQPPPNARAGGGGARPARRPRGARRAQRRLLQERVLRLRLAGTRPARTRTSLNNQCPIPHASQSHLQSTRNRTAGHGSIAHCGPVVLRGRDRLLPGALSFHALRAHRTRLSSLRLSAARAGDETGPADANAREGAGQRGPVGARGGLRAQAVGGARAGVAHRRRQRALLSLESPLPTGPFTLHIPIPLAFPRNLFHLNDAIRTFG